MDQNEKQNAALANNPFLNSVPKNSPQWEALSTYFQLCAHTSRVKIKGMWSISNPAVIERAEHRYGGKMMIGCWLPIEGLDSRKVSDIFRKGVSVDEKGLMVSYGRLTFPDVPMFIFKQKPVGCGKRDAAVMRWLDAKRLSPTRSIYEFLFCDVYVGLSHPIESWVEALSFNRNSLPVDFDSVIVVADKDYRDEALDPLNLFKGPIGESVSGSFGPGSKSEIDGVGPKAVSDQRLLATLHPGLTTSSMAVLLPQSRFKVYFKVFYSTQIVPRYFVTVEASPLEVELFGLPLCGNCLEMPSKAFCLADEVPLCEICDEYLHAINKITQRHVRVALNRRPRPPGQCREHPHETCNLYCVMCEGPVCDKCRSNHYHGYPSVEPSSAQFVPIMEAVEAFLQDTIEAEQGASKSGSPFSGRTAEIIGERRIALQAKLDELNEVRKRIFSKRPEIEDEVYRMATAALSTLAANADQAMRRLLELQADRERQISLLKSSEEFLKYLRSVLPPADLLRAW